MPSDSLVGNSLTAILPVVYARGYDYKNFLSRMCNCACRHFYWPSSVAYSVTSSITNRKTSCKQENADDGFTCRIACGFADSQASWQKSGGYNRSRVARRVTCNFAKGKTRSHKDRGSGSKPSPLSLAW